METKLKATKENPKAVNQEKKAEEKNGNPTANLKETDVIKMLNPTAEQRIKNMENFKILSERYQFLQDKDNELQRFIISSDGTKEKITLSNANGFTFEVTNSQTIKAVTEVIHKHLKEMLTTAEKEVLAFSI